VSRGGGADQVNPSGIAEESGSAYTAAELQNQKDIQMKNREAPELLVGACTRCGGSAKYDAKESSYRCMMCARAVLPVQFDMKLLDAETAIEVYRDTKVAAESGA
jgi:hypothetical protein